MPLYSYTAVSLKGEKTSERQNAKDEKELAKNLYDQGLVLVSVRDEEQKKGLSAPLSFGNLFGVSLKDKLMFIRNLKVMVSAGVPLPRALEVLSEQTSNKAFHKAIEEIKERIMKGSMLSEAMQAYPKIFPDLFVSMVKVGEESGTMESVLSQLALQVEKQYTLRSKVMGALMYPMVILIAMTGIGIMMLVVVVPTLAKTFGEFGVDLPITTRFVIGLGNFLIQRWYIMLGIVVACGIGFWKGAHTKIGKSIIDVIVLQAPIISEITHKTNSATTLRTLSSLMTSGVPIVRALEITSRVVGNGSFQKALENSTEQVREGAKLSESLKSYKHLYPLLVIQMMEVGEESGQTSEVLSKLAEFYEDEVAQITANFSAVIEPVLMLIIGAFVGFFAISMLQPMYSLLGSVQ